MLDEREKITLANLHCGGLQEKFEAALSKILDNIQDPNTKATDPRKLTINITFKPSKSRGEAELIYGTSLKLASAEEHSTFAFIRRSQAGLGLSEYPQTMDLETHIEKTKQAQKAEEEETPEGEGKVVDIKKGAN